MARLYAFRYPVDIQTALAPWREKLGDQYEQVVATLSDRDRALEDHVALGMSQGRLAYATSTAFQAGITSEVDLTGLSVTVTVPANRVLQITGQAVFSLGTNSTAAGLIYEDASQVSYFGVMNNFTASTYESLQHGAAIVTPAAGTHTYKLRGIRSSGAANLSIGGVAVAPAFILVEDIGPVL